MPYGNRQHPQLSWTPGQTVGEGIATTPLGSIYERDRLPDGRLRATYRPTAEAAPEVLYIGSGDTAYTKCVNHFHKMWDRKRNKQQAEPVDTPEPNPASAATWNIRLGEEKTRAQIAELTGGDHRYRGIVPTDDNITLYSDHEEAREFGYDYDGWDPDLGLFFYTGEVEAPARLVGGSVGLHSLESAADRLADPHLCSERVFRRAPPSNRQRRSRGAIPMLDL